MTYTLAIGDRSYSSWSLRGWLMLAKFGLPVRVRRAHLYTDAFQALLAEFAPARRVPALRIEGLGVVWDTLAIAETLAERHPGHGLWPADPAARAFGRALAAEMHSGFGALRDACPMNLRHAYRGFEPDADVRDDLARMECLWSRARAQFGADGPWLLGAYSLADVFYAPTAARIATYGLPVGDAARDYVTLHLSDPDFRQWRAMGLAESFVQPGYELDLPNAPWPGPLPPPARAVTSGRPENAVCPYSGDPVAVDSLAEIDGRTVGFCNPFCRDKSVADAGAWPQLRGLLGPS